MLNSFLDLSTPVLCLLCATVSIVLSVGALILIRKKFRIELFQKNHEVAGFLFNALGLIYAVLVAFVVYVTWDKFEDAEVNVDSEANQLHDLYLISNVFTPSDKTEIREKIINYINIVINEEWELMENGDGSPNARNTLNDIWNVYFKLDSLDTYNKQTIYSESMKRLTVLTDNRRMRLLNSNNTIPGIIWVVIIMGALTSVGFTLFFGADNIVLQSIMTALFAMTNAMVLLLILVLDYAFAGDVKITPEAFIQILNNIQKLPPGM